MTAICTLFLAMVLVSILENIAYYLKYRKFFGLFWYSVLLAIFTFILVAAWM